MAYTRLSNLEFIDLPDCVALMENGRCARLKIPKCQGKSCSFQCTREEAAQSYERLCSRLSELGKEAQNKIARKYYGGQKLWDTGAGQ